MGGPYNEQCDEWHESPCILGEDQEEMALLWAQLDAGIAVEELAGRLQASSPRIRFVPQRKAIQFEGCNGLIIANIPLMDAHAAALHTRLLATGRNVRGSAASEWLGPRLET